MKDGDFSMWATWSARSFAMAANFAPLHFRGPAWKNSMMSWASGSKGC